MAAANNTVPLATVAKLLDLTERRVNQLAKEGVLPRLLEERMRKFGAQDY